MTPNELEHWRTEQFAKIHKEAIRLVGLTNEKKLREGNIELADVVRSYEVLLRNDLGVRMSQNLLEGMDIKGLDLRRLRGLNQQQIDHAVGDGATQIPDYLRVPSTWAGQS